jgi:hypothetical protein
MFVLRLGIRYWGIHSPNISIWGVWMFSIFGRCIWSQYWLGQLMLCETPPEWPASSLDIAGHWAQQGASLSPTRRPTQIELTPHPNRAAAQIEVPFGFQGPLLSADALALHLTLPPPAHSHRRISKYSHLQVGRAPPEARRGRAPAIPSGVERICACMPVWRILHLAFLSMSHQGQRTWRVEHRSRKGTKQIKTLKL